MPVGLSRHVCFPVSAPQPPPRELNDIADGEITWRGCVPAMCRQKCGSQYLQALIDQGDPEIRGDMFCEVIEGSPLDIIRDQFGNYVVQKLLRRGAPHEVQQLGKIIVDNCLQLSVHMYGCRVLQSALDVISPLDRSTIVKHLSTAIVDIVKDQHGNHVIQKCIEVLPEATDIITFSLKNLLVDVSKHIYGCRIIERIIAEYQRGDRGIAEENRIGHVMAELFSGIESLVEDQFGNYVIQYVITTSKECYARVVYTNIINNLLRYSLHKFASNVVENCFSASQPPEKAEFIKMLLSPEAPGRPLRIVSLSDNQFGNYVVQKIVEHSGRQDLEYVISAIGVNFWELLRSSFGKVVVQKLVKVCDKNGIIVPMELYYAAREGLGNEMHHVPPPHMVFGPPPPPPPPPGMMPHPHHIPGHLPPGPGWGFPYPPPVGHPHPPHAFPPSIINQPIIHRQSEVPDLPPLIPTDDADLESNGPSTSRNPTPHLESLELPNNQNNNQNQNQNQNPIYGNTSYDNNNNSSAYNNNNNNNQSNGSGVYNNPTTDTRSDVLLNDIDWSYVASGQEVVEPRMWEPSQESSLNQKVISTSGLIAVGSSIFSVHTLVGSLHHAVASELNREPESVSISDTVGNVLHPNAQLASVGAFTIQLDGESTLYTPPMGGSYMADDVQPEMLQN